MLEKIEVGKSYIDQDGDKINILAIGEVELFYSFYDNDGDYRESSMGIEFAKRTCSQSGKLEWELSEDYEYDPFQAFWDHEFNFSEENQKLQNMQSFKTAWDHQQSKLDAKDKLLREAVKLIENAETQYITYEPNRWSDFLSKPEIEQLRGEK